MAEKESNCPICNSKAKEFREGLAGRSIYECGNCGKYVINDLEVAEIDKIGKNVLAAYLYYNCWIPKQNNENILFHIGSEKEFENVKKNCPNIRQLTDEIVKFWFPTSFNEKVNLLLLGLEKQSSYIGYEVPLSGEHIKSLFFVKRYVDNGNINYNVNSQIKLLSDYLTEQNLIKIEQGLITILPEGWRRIDELQKNRSDSSQVFVAMSFSDETKNVREAIRKGIKDSGYFAHFIDEKEHNNQIVPEILYEIRRSKFVIAEFTTNNNGAYYEAGYAAGLGKEVIHICNYDKFKEEGHFDIKQKSTVLWETENDIPEALFKRIEATIGKGR